jgi:hypothetical protein
LAEGIHRVQAARVARQETASGQGGVTDSDMVAALAHGRPTRIYVAPLSKKKHRMVPERFIAYTRFVLRIPQLQKLDNARAESGLDYHVESCIGAHTKEVKGEPDSEQVRAARLMDLNGNHANSNCLTTMAGRAHIHNELVNAVYDAALEAGVKAQPRPQTHVMLLNQFTAEECRTLFPRQARKGYQARARGLLAELAEQDRTDTEGVAALKERVDALMAEGQESRPAGKAGSKAGQALRLDLVLTDSNGEELWLDPTCIHTTNKSNRGPEAWPDGPGRD